MPQAEWEQHRERIINHMNDDHVEHMIDMIHHSSGEKPSSVKLIEISPEGFNIQADDNTHFLAFAQPCTTPREMAMEAARLANYAREQLEKIGK